MRGASLETGDGGGEEKEEEDEEEAGWHIGPEQSKIQTAVQGYSLVHSLVRLYRSLICLLTHFAHSRARGKENN